MGFGGQNNSEKQNDAAIKGINTQLGGVAGTAGDRATKSFKFFTKSAKPAMEYWNTLLSGDRTAIGQLLGPEISNISNNYKNAKMSLWNSPRGGGKASAVNELGAQEAQQIGDLYSKARPMAAQHLEGLAGMFGNLSLGEQGIGLNALSGQSRNLFGLNDEQEQVRQRQAQAWAGLGSGIGGIAGSLFTGGLGGGKGKPSGGGGFGGK